MEALGVVGRLSNLNTHDAVAYISDTLLDRIWDSEGVISLSRRVFITWLILYVGSLLLYFTFATLDYLVVFRLLKHRLLPPGHAESCELRREIRMSVVSLSIMAFMSTPAEVAIQLGYGKVYYDPAEHGYAYLILSPLWFLVFSDCIIYFIHRGLHHRLLYKYIHKPHHSFINTSPYAAFAFHPLDGYLQGLPYQLFVFLFPFHSAIHLISLSLVSLWTINIHDRVTLGIPGVNGAGHHAIHHTTFKSNYGQYTTLWDKLGGTFKDPRLWTKAGAPALTEKMVYGKDA